MAGGIRKEVPWNRVDFFFVTDYCQATKISLRGHLETWLGDNLWHKKEEWGKIFSEVASFSQFNKMGVNVETRLNSEGKVYMAWGPWSCLVETYIMPQLVFETNKISSTIYHVNWPCGTCLILDLCGFF